jgi:hypothetical protein
MDADLDRLGGRQQGLLTTWQLLAAGWTHGRIRRAVEAGSLIPYRHGVYRVRGAPVTRHQAWLAAVLGCRCDAVLAFATASTAWGFRWFAEDDRIHVLREGTAYTRQPGVIGHRTLSLPAHDRTRLLQIPITTAERTFVDRCGDLPGKLLGLAGDDLVRRRLLVLPRLVRCVEQIPVSGRRRIAPVRPFLAARVEGYDPGGSEPELDVGRVLVRARVEPMPVQQFRVTVEGHQYRLDYAWPHVRHYLEYQGIDVHGQPSSLHADSERTRRLNRAGWTGWPLTATTTANEIVAIARYVLSLSGTNARPGRVSARKPVGGGPASRW